MKMSDFITFFNSIYKTLDDIYFSIDSWDRLYLDKHSSKFTEIPNFLSFGRHRLVFRFNDRVFKVSDSEANLREWNIYKSADDEKKKYLSKCFRCKTLHDLNRKFYILEQEFVEGNTLEYFKRNNMLIKDIYYWQYYDREISPKAKEFNIDDVMAQNVIILPNNEFKFIDYAETIR